MLNNLFQSIGAGIVVIALSISSFLGFDITSQIREQVKQEILQEISQPVIQNPSIEQLTELFGTTNFVGGGRYKLSGSGIDSDDTSLNLQSFKQPVSEVELSMDDFGSIGYGTIEPGTSNKEFISFTGVTQDGSTDKATLTGVTRGLTFVSPYTASSTLGKSHSGGTILIISNPPQLYNRLATKDNAETISGVWTFGSTTIPRMDTYVAPTNDYEFTAKGYVDTVATSGAANADDVTGGLVERAEEWEIVNSEATGTDAELFVRTDYFSTTTKASTTIPVTDTGGKISQGFIDLDEAFDWNGNGIWASSSSNEFSTSTTLTLNGTTTINGSTTFSVAPEASADPHNNNALTRKSYVDSTAKDFTTATYASTTGSRATSTAYQNSATAWRFVNVTFNFASANTNEMAYIGETEATTSVARIQPPTSGTVYQQITFWVPPSYYYMIEDSTGGGTISIDNWWELDFE